MARSHAILALLLALLWNINSCHALKGLKRSLRSLLDDPAGGENIFEERTEPPDVGDEESAPLKDDKKKDDKKDNKKEDKKKDKRDKKCKKRDKEPKSSQEEEDSNESTQDIPGNGTEPHNGSSPLLNATEPHDGSSPVVNATETPEDDTLEPWCEDPTILTKGDCEQLEERVYPTEESVDGSLYLEVTPKADNLTQGMERLLTEDTALASVGCSTRRLLQDSDASSNMTLFWQDDETDTNATVYLLGMEVRTPSQTSDKCTSTADENCTIITSSVVIHYSGNATDEQKMAMFDTLTNTILMQVENGEFDSIASIHYAEAAIEEESEYVGTNSSPKSSPPAGAIGAIIGGIVVITLLVAGVLYMRRRDGDGCGSAPVVPNSNNSSSNDGVRAHVFG